MRAAVIVACLAIASPAFAQPPGLTPPGMTPALEPQPQPLRRQKDRGTAVLASLGGSIAPILIVAAVAEESDETTLWLFGASAVLLPSAGHWYAGKFLTTGMGIRVVSGAVTLLSIAALVQHDDGGGDMFATTASLGMLGLLVGATWDLATAPSAVDDWNKKHATAIAPAPMRLGTGYGVGLVGRF